MRHLATRLVGACAVVGAIPPPTTAHAQEPGPETTVVEAPAPSDQLEIKLLEVPVDRQDDPRARIYVVDHVAPGTTLTRTIALANQSPAPLAVTTYPGAADIRDAEFRFGDGAGGNELAEWTTLDPGHLDVAPGTQAPATLTIRVPSDASPGERYAVAWAEMTSAAPPGGGVRQVNRVGIRIYLSVGPGAEPASDFSIGKIRADRDADGQTAVTATVKNTGGRALDLAGQLALSDGPAGLDAGPFRTPRSTTLGIGESAKLTIPLDGRIPGGKWKAALTLASGRVEHTRTQPITLPGDAPSSSDGIPLALLLLAGGAAIVVGATAMLLRRRHNARADT